MAVPDSYDFSGYATKNDLTCTDGRVIRRDAFKGNDGMSVPLVWQHFHNRPEDVLGHAILENREDGVYAYGKFNDTPSGKNSKLLVNNGDIKFLSIYANQLEQQAKNVVHGVIREVSLVLAGANPGATIDNLAFGHGDGTAVEDETEVVMTTGETITAFKAKEVAPVQEVSKEVKMADSSTTELEHAVKNDKAAKAGEDETLEDIFNTLTDKQKNVVYAMVSAVADAVAQEKDSAMKQSDLENKDEVMKNNVFDNTAVAEEAKKNTLSHAQWDEIVGDAKRIGSLKQSLLAHVQDYGITDIEFLFPDAQAVTNSPSLLSRRMDWVSSVINGTIHSPFARIKSITADITADAARARGYVKGNEKENEIIRLLRRITLPKTIYKKQKLDRDDLVDITDIDIVAWMKGEMRVMLDEEIARAILVGDGRDPASDDKIDETSLRPIWTDDNMYAHHIRLTEASETEDIVDAIIRGRENYFGSGMPSFYAGTGFVSDMLLLKDTTGRRIYNTIAELEAVLRVAKIVEVPLMTGLSRESEDQVPVHLDLVGIVVNLKDYTIGSDKGGAVSMFEDFDIDYNQLKYLLETRISGALTQPKSALVIEKVGAAG